MSTSIEELIDELSTDQLKQLLLKYSKIHHDLHDELLSIQEAQRIKSVKLVAGMWLCSILSAIAHDVGDDEFEERSSYDIDWFDTIKTVKKAVNDLITRQLFWEALQLIDEATAEIHEIMNRVQGPNYEGPRMDFDDEWIDEFDKLSARLVKLDPSLKSHVFAHFREHVQDGSLRKVWFSSFKGKTDKEDQLKALQTYITKNYRRGIPRYRQEHITIGHYLVVAFDLIKSLTPKEIPTFFAKYNDNHELRERMEAYLITGKKFETAVALLQEDLQSNPSDYDKSDLLMSVFEKMGRPDSVALELKRRILENTRITYKEFERYRELVGEKAWTDLCLEVIDNPKFDDELRIQLCKATEQPERLKRVLEFIVQKLKQEDIRTLRQGTALVTEYLEPCDQYISKYYPELIQNLITDFVFSRLTQVRQKVEYAAMAECLNYLTNCGGSREKAARDCADKLKDLYKRRSTLLTVFSQNGF